MSCPRGEDQPRLLQDLDVYLRRLLPLPRILRLDRHVDGVPRVMYARDSLQLHTGGGTLVMGPGPSVTSEPRE